MFDIKNNVLKFLSIFLLFYIPNFIFCNPPNPVTDLKVLEVRFRQVKLSWTAPVSSVPVAFYEIRVSTYRIISTEDDWNNNSTQTSYPYRVAITTSPLQGETTTYTFTNLENGKIYFFAIKSSTAAYTGEMSAIDVSIPRAFAQPVNTSPSEFLPLWPLSSVVVTSTTFIPFDWEDAIDPDQPYGDSLRYEFYYSTKSVLLNSPPILTGANVISNISTSYIMIDVNNFADNTTYYWRVKAIDYEGAWVWNGVIYQKEPIFISNHTPQPPSSVYLFSPVNTSTVSTISGVYFDWLDVSDPDPQDEIKYSLYISSQGKNYGFVQQVGDISYSSFTLISIFDGWRENTTYWWYITAKDKFGLETFSSTWYFIVNNIEEPPAENFLISPGTTIYFQLNPFNYNHISFTLYPTFYWTPSSDPDVYGSVFYQIFISSWSDKPSELNSVFYSVDRIFTTYYHLASPVLQNSTTYYWRVRVLDEPYSDYEIYSSTVYWFYTCVENYPPTAATLISPGNNFTTSYFYPRFEWLPGVDIGFNAYVSSQSLIYWTDTATLTVSGLSPSTSFYVVAEKLKNNATYYWQVITYDNTYPPPQKSSSSAVFKFFVRNSSPTTFELLFPPNGSIVETKNVQLFWTSANEPDNEEVFYRIVYSTDNFKSFFSSSGIKSSNFILYDLLDNTTYFWYVYAYDRWGFTTGASATFYFVVDNIPVSPSGFSLLYPQNNSVLFVPYTTFYWELALDSDPYELVSYNLLISTAENFGNIKFSTVTTNLQFFVARGILEINTTYYWQVIAISSRTGVTIAQNSPFVFYIHNTPPTKPLLAYPQNKVILTSSAVLLQWSFSVDLQNDIFFYELFYSSNNKTSWEKIVLTSQQNIFSLTDLIDDSTYYWYVVAVDTYANTNVSDEFVFYTQYLNQPPSIPQILSPVDNEIVKLPYNILWSTATDFDIFDSVLYKIEISSMESFIPLLIEKTQSYTSFTLTREVPPGVYYLRILACDSFGGISTSTVVKFIVPYYTIQNYAPTNNSVITNLPIEFSFSQIDPVVINDTITYKIILSTYSNFMYKQEILLSNTYYYLSSPPLFPARYYWYVVALDSYGRSVESPVWNFLVPLVYPAAPKSVVVSTSVVGLVLSWEKINIENFWGYKVYRGYDIEDVNQLIFFSTFTSCIDEKGIVGDYFYTVKTVNQFGIESVDNIYIKVSQGKQLNFYISEDKNVIVSIIKDEDVDEIHIIRCQDEENDKIKYVYKILPLIDKTKIGNFYEINFGHLAKDKKYLVEYYDGYNWIEIPFSFQYNKLVVKTQYFGKYRVVEIEKVSQVKKLTILGCSPQKRIITPNNDGKNDYIEFQCDTNSYLDGEIYDIKLRKICKLKRKDKNVIYFDGYDDDGNLLPAGLYVYYISLKPSGETFSDTILIKY